jgi:hypothetical protein
MGDFSQKFFLEFFYIPFAEGIIPPYTIKKGGGERGGIPPGDVGEGYRGVFSGRGITKTPQQKMRGEDVSLIYTSNVMRSY